VHAHMRPTERPAVAGLSKLNSVNLRIRLHPERMPAISTVVEVDVILGDPAIRTSAPKAHPSTGPGASGVRAPESLERR
jgi:hypothetical protein